MPPNDGPRRVPRTINLILVLLETDEPPTADPHAQHSEDDPYDRTCQECTATPTCQGDEKTTPRAGY